MKLKITVEICVNTRYFIHVKPIKRILLLRPDKAGDALKSLPALRAAAAAFPDYEWHCLHSKHNQSILVAEPYLHLREMPSQWENASVEELHRWLHSGPDFSWDAVVNLLPDATPSILKLEKALGTKLHFVPAPQGIDEALNIAQLLSKAIGADFKKDIPKFSRAPVLHKQDHAEAQAVLGEKRTRWMGLCPLGGETARTPRACVWRNYLDFLARQYNDYSFFLFGTPQDKQRLIQIRGRLSQAQVKIIHPSNFRALGAFLLRMDLIAAVDSGPLHLACALGCPTIGFMSGGDQGRWCPPQTKFQAILRRGILSRFPSYVEMVLFHRNTLAQWKLL